MQHNKLSQVGSYMFIEGIRLHTRVSASVAAPVCVGLRQRRDRINARMPRLSDMVQHKIDVRAGNTAL